VRPSYFLHAEAKPRRSINVFSLLAFNDFRAFLQGNATIGAATTAASVGLPGRFDLSILRETSRSTKLQLSVVSSSTGRETLPENKLHIFILHVLSFEPPSDLYPRCDKPTSTLGKTGEGKINTNFWRHTIIVSERYTKKNDRQ